MKRQDTGQLQDAGQLYQDMLSKEYIEKELVAAGISLKTEILEEISSTSTLLRQYAEAGERQDMLLLAEHQTGGRGRKGRSFFSPKGMGLYMSLLLHPKAPAGEVYMLTTLAAAATAKALEKISGKEVQIKWVNDILIGGKKVVGILTESSGTITDGCFDYVIVGIGINVYEPIGGFPEEIRDVAGAVFAEADLQESRSGIIAEQENGSRITKEGEPQRGLCRSELHNLRSRVAAETVKLFMEFYRTFPGKAYLEEYRSRSFLNGKEVRIIPTEHITGDVSKAEGKASQMPVYATVLGIDEACRLQVRYEDGREELLSNGEVSVRER